MWPQSSHSGQMQGKRGTSQHAMATGHKPRSEDACIPSPNHPRRWLWVYGLLTALVVVLGLARAFLFFSAALRASSRLHDAMVTRVLRAPLSFFHTNPAGRSRNCTSS